MFAERDDVSDVEYWDCVYNQAMQENGDIANQPVADFNFETIERNDEEDVLP